ncbi:hypothetical protein LPB140_01505 [Sphingorhabdus lutea]|uniref:DUF2497 domain-containing protein n=1 Tax=Sphingorhabdus lutea TaxID=1913578 RepID=A0A1L3J9F7_9SPHN|nr:DUF2497 domain-containing protein [Sphingorhabdus lutea]APG61723.1 hypothetical protein LPB140_01505 [Sphingorhabdus lutea]
MAQNDGKNGEPTVNEILSSIKKIIAQDDGLRTRTRDRAARDVLELSADNAVDDHDMPHMTAPLDGQFDDDAGLIDNAKAQSLRHSLSALATLAEPGVSPQIVRSGETSLEGMVREMLKPVLKQWLDDNLPDMVEAMVAKEIARITRKG